MHKPLTDELLQRYSSREWLKSNIASIDEAFDLIISIAEKIKNFRSKFPWMRVVQDYPKVSAIIAIICVISVVQSGLAKHMFDRFFPPTQAVLSDSDAFYDSDEYKYTSEQFELIQATVMEHSDALEEFIEDDHKDLKQHFDNQLLFHRVPRGKK